MAKKKGNTVNLAIVGCGGMAGAHLNGYEELARRGETRFRIVGAVDAAKERADAFRFPPGRESRLGGSRLPHRRATAQQRPDH